MKITYIGHSGFSVELEEHVLIFDYYTGVLPAFNAAKKVYVFASHSHYDHFNKKIFDWGCADGVLAEMKSVTYVLSSDIDAKKNDTVYYLEANQEVKVGELDIITLKSTDLGVAFWVRCEGRVIYHAGDLHWWYWEGEPDPWNPEVEAAFKGEIARLKPELVDVAFLPLDPRLEEQYAWGFDYFMKHTDTRWVFPMHFWGKYRIIDKFLQDPVSLVYRDKIVPVKQEGQQWRLVERT